MNNYIEKKFNIHDLQGISKKTIEEHLKLYAGYVTHSNAVLEKIQELSSDPEKNMPLLSGLLRRLSFEYNGMRNHEIYFELLSNGIMPPNTESALYQAIASEWGSFEKWLTLFKAIATTRGIGWAMLFYDRKSGRLLSSWVDEQHLGQLQDAAPIIALDMWEHSYVADYHPSGKKQYIEDFFANLNWKKAEENFAEASA